MKFFEGMGRQGPTGQILVAMQIQGSWVGIAIGIQEFFKGFFIYYCDSRRQPRIKPENLGQRFELYEYI